jgi:hypothetical protein
MEIASVALPIHAGSAHEQLSASSADGALDFTARIMASLYSGNPSRNLRPPRLPDLTSPNLFLLDYPKERVYRKIPRNIEALKDNIRLEIANIERYSVANGEQHRTSCSGVSRRGRQPFYHLM